MNAATIAKIYITVITIPIFFKNITPFLNSVVLGIV